MRQFLILTTSIICVAFHSMKIQSTFIDADAIAQQNMSKQLTEEEIKSEVQKLAATEPFTDSQAETRKAEQQRLFEEERGRLLKELEELRRQERQQEPGRLSDAARRDAARLQELRTLIEKEIGTPSASESKQCKLIAFGSKPCGGPWSYLVYSTATTNEVRLKQLVNEYSQLEQKLNIERRLKSDCEFVSEPRVAFVGGVCAIKNK